MLDDFVGERIIQRVTLSEQDSSELLKVLDGTFHPNLALKSALADAKKLVRRV